MKAKSIKEVTVTLTLTEEETEMLMSMVQNPINGEHPDDEDGAVRDFRTALFNTLRDALATPRWTSKERIAPEIILGK